MMTLEFTSSCDLFLAVPSPAVTNSPVLRLSHIQVTELLKVRQKPISTATLVLTELDPKVATYQSSQSHRHGRSRILMSS